MSIDKAQELDIIQNAYKGLISPCENPDSPLEWARLGFYLGFQVFEMIRPWRFKIAELKQIIKEDGSPATDLEERAEAFVKETLAQFYPNASFWGEESGAATTSEQKILVIMDPIDGTRSFLGGFDTYALTLSILNQNKPVFSLICAPATGDFAYRIAESPSRIFQYPLHNHSLEVRELPYIEQEEHGPILVNMHPSRGSLKYLEHLYGLWNDTKISLVKSISGSPSQLILEIARGGGIYANMWSGGKTMPYDLITAMHMLLGAGGYMLNLSGEEINPWEHQGMYLAGISRSHLAFLIAELQSL